MLSNKDIDDMLHPVIEEDLLLEYNSISETIRVELMPLLKELTIIEEND